MMQITSAPPPCSLRHLLVHRNLECNDPSLPSLMGMFLDSEVLASFYE